MFFTITAISICFFYCLLILAFYYGWSQIKAFSKTSENPDIFVSIIIAVRNEEINIENLLNDLQQQDFPKEKYEVIIVDDFSTDGTSGILERFCKTHLNMFSYKLPVNLSGKKAAITYAIKKATGSLIITTDGDCRMGEKWISTIISFYVTYKPEMILAPVFFNSEKNIFETLQTLEFSSLIASGAGAAGINRSIMCNAANLAFEKTIVSETNDSLNKNFASGDDVFLLHKLKKDNGKILFLKSVDAVVYTKPQTDISSFVSQRIRWTGKSKGYTDKDTLIVAYITFFINLTLFGSLIAGFFDSFYFVLFGLLFVLKTIVEIILLNSFLGFFKKQKLLIWFIPLQLIYFVYVSFIGIFGGFVKVSWKGRKI